MYIGKPRTFYDRDGSQRTSSSKFLIILQHGDKPLGPDNFRAIVRKVALSQLGHWMMGTARIKGHSISLSGSYGGDGLPVTTEIDEVYEAAIPVPLELYKAWSAGGGHNSCGSEAGAMRDWALKNIKELTK